MINVSDILVHPLTRQSYSSETNLFLGIVRLPRI